MTDKQIIIDDVDVSGCLFYQVNFEEDYDVEIKHYCSNWHNSCESNNNTNCYYKQLKRKEQECEKLKEAIDGLLKIQYQLADSCTKYEQTLAEIKEMLKEICMEECSFDWNKTSKKHCGDCDCRYGQILQKISECEVKNEN